MLLTQPAPDADSAVGGLDPSPPGLIMGGDLKEVKQRGRGNLGRESHPIFFTCLALMSRVTENLK